MNAVKHLSLITIGLLLLGCSNHDAVRPTVATSSAIVEATKATPASPQSDQKSTEPVTTNHQAYMMAREYLRSKNHNSDHDIGDFEVRYKKEEEVWHVHVSYIPARPGSFATLYVSKKEAKVIRFDGGE